MPPRSKHSRSNAIDDKKGKKPQLEQPSVNLSSESQGEHQLVPFQTVREQLGFPCDLDKPPRYVRPSELMICQQTLICLPFAAS